MGIYCYGRNSDFEFAGPDMELAVPCLDCCFLKRNLVNIPGSWRVHLGLTSCYSRGKTWLSELQSEYSLVIDCGCESRRVLPCTLLIDLPSHWRGPSVITTRCDRMTMRTELWLTLHIRLWAVWTASCLHIHGGYLSCMDVIVHLC